MYCQLDNLGLFVVSTAVSIMPGALAAPSDFALVSIILLQTLEGKMGHFEVLGKMW